MVTGLLYCNFIKLYKITDMSEEKTIYYIYINNGKEYFTANEDLAHKRADEGTEIKVYNQD